MKKRGVLHSESYHWFSAAMGFVGAACLIYARVWRIPNLGPLQVTFMLTFLVFSGGDHTRKALAARKEKAGRAV